MEHHTSMTGQHSSYAFHYTYYSLSHKPHSPQINYSPLMKYDPPTTQYIFVVSHSAFQSAVSYAFSSSIKHRRSCFHFLHFSHSCRKLNLWSTHSSTPKTTLHVSSHFLCFIYYAVYNDPCIFLTLFLEYSAT